MLARLCAFLIWALVAGTAVFWGLRLFVKAPPAPAGVATVESSAAVRGDLTRLFGAAPVQVVDVAAPPPESSRFKLSGLMSPRDSGSYGIALIAVDGKPARAYKVGARLDGQMTLQSVGRRSATVGAAGAGPSFTLDMPALPTASTGTLPPAVNVNLSAAPAPAPFVPPPQPVPNQAVVQQLSSDQLINEAEQPQAPAPAPATRQLPGRFGNPPATQR